MAMAAFVSSSRSTTMGKCVQLLVLQHFSWLKNVQIRARLGNRYQESHKPRFAASSLTKLHLLISLRRQRKPLQNVRLTHRGISIYFDR